MKVKTQPIRNMGVAGVLGAAALVAAPAAAWAGAGGLDPAFGAGNVVRGQVTTAFSTEKDAIYAMALQPDGKIISAGLSGSRIAVARYNPDGTLDPGFGKDGKKITAVGKLAEGRAVALQPDGKIVVAGFSVEPGVGTSFAMHRYTTTGKSDPAFGYGGAVVSRVASPADSAYAVAVQPDGKIILVGGSGGAAHSKIAMVRYTADGRPDDSFGGKSTVTTALGTSARGSAVALQPDGKIVVAGARTDKKGTDFAVVRYTAAGRPDTGFGTEGHAVTDFGTKEDTAHGLVVQPDGKIVAAGTAGTRIGVARLTAQGKPDASFGGPAEPGRVTTEAGRSAAGRALALQRDGKLVVAGYEHSPGTGDSVAVVRYLPDGESDPGFGTDGVARSDFGTPSDRGHAVVVQPDGKILVGGRSHHPVQGDSFALTRLLGG